MSEKWETVSKAGGQGARSNKAHQTNGKPGNGAANGKPKKEQKVYTVEDVLPAASVVNSFASAFDPAPKSPKKDANGVSKPAVKPKPSAPRVEKPVVPKTVAEAVKAKVKVEELKTVIEEVQLRWPDSPLLWLRDVAGYLNHALVTQPELAVEGVLGREPLTALTANMKKVIGGMLQKCEDGMRETFFETCVANTAHDLAKGQCVTGWRVLTQLLADLQPTVVTAHIPRYVELRNSYQNRPAVGLAILWSVGQAGHKSLHSGIKVWLEIMLPVITMRHYTKFCVDYLESLLAAHAITPATQLNKPVMDISNFLTVQDTVFVVSAGMNKEQAKALACLYPSLRTICLAGCRNHELLPALLPRLANLSSQEQVLDTLEVLSSCLAASPAAMVHWHKAFTSHLTQSGQLLNYLDANWGQYRAALDVPDFQETIEAFQDYNDSVANKEGLQLATEGANAVAARFSSPGMAWFPWKTLSFLLLIGTAAIVNIDVQRSGGSFKGSNTGQLLWDVGQYDRAVSCHSWVLASSSQSRAWLEVNTRQGRTWAEASLPLYLAHGRQVAGPYMELARAKAGEAGALALLGLERLQEAGARGRVALQEALPGLEEKLEAGGLAASRWGALVLARAQVLGGACREGALQLVNGEVDWTGVRKGLVEAVERAQEQVVSLVSYVQLQVQQMIK